MDRLENILGAQALALTDRLLSEPGPSEAGSAEAGSAAQPSSEQAALVTLTAHPGRPVSWLGGVLGLSSSGITRLLDRLVAEGLVTRTAGGDGRSRTVDLTPRGRERARRLTASRGRSMSDALVGLTPQDRADLERLLGLVVANLAPTRVPALRVCRLCDRTACASNGRECPLEATGRDR